MVFVQRKAKKWQAKAFEIYLHLESRSLIGVKSKDALRTLLGSTGVSTLSTSANEKKQPIKIKYPTITDLATQTLTSFAQLSRPFLIYAD